jgi:ribose 5-phosphate isomerase B
MQIYIGSDHAGVEMKKGLEAYLKTKPEMKVLDLGVFTTDRVDYPDIAREVSEKVLENAGSFGILICGTGVGMSIAANRRSGIRAALLVNDYVTKMARADDDANVACLGSRWQDLETMKKLIDIFLSTAFYAGDDGRHERRVSKIEKMLEGRQDASKGSDGPEIESKC